MKDYGLQRSAVKPLGVEIAESKVFVATNIELITVQDEKSEREEYQFNYVEYDKDEYISNLEKQVTETQMALCDIYEMVVN